MRKQIIMVGTSFATRGGVSAVVNVLRASGLFDRSHIHYVTTHKDGHKIEKLIQAIKGGGHFLYLVTTQKIDLVHIHTSSDASFWRKSFFFLTSKIFGLPYILQMHSGDMDNYYHNLDDLRRKLMHYIFSHASCVIALSKEWQSWLITNMPTVKVKVIPNPIIIPDSIEPYSNREDATLLFLGQMNTYKGIYLLLSAIANLADEFPNLCLLAGGDREVDKVKAEAKKLNIADRVHVLGWVTGQAKLDVMKRATIFVLPSYIENFPMSILEAMAIGLPIVSTQVGGIPSAIDHGVHGLLVPPGDTLALTDALRKLLLDPNLRQTIGQAARQKAIAQFSAETIVADLEALYCEIIGQLH